MFIMVLSMRPAIHHLGYVVADLSASVDHFATKLGAGPFTVIEHVPLEATTPSGDAATYDHSAAFGMWGDIPLELVEVHAAAPVTFEGTIPGAPPELHHIAWAVDDLDVAAAELDAAGCSQVLRATLGDIRFTFHEARATHGHQLELHQDGPALQAFWADVRAAAA